jgi:HK97 family phage portal protein
MTLFRSAERSGFSGSPSYNPFENPSLPLASVGFDNVYGLTARSGNNSGENVTVDRALTIPTVWRCVGILATVIAGCPLLVYKDPGKKLVRVPALDPGNTELTYTPFELWELVVAHLALWGNGFVRKVRNGSDAITDLIPVNPSLVKVSRCKKDGKHTDGKLFTIDHGDAKYEYAGNWDIMHIPGMGYDGLQGMSPLQMAAQTYGTALAADKLAAKFFSQGTSLTGILNVKAPLSDQTQADEIKRRWRMVNAGANHGGDIAVLDAETTFQQLTIPPDQLQFLESRQWNTSEISRIYGIPPHLIGEVTKSTSWGTGIEQQNIGFVAYTIAGWTSRIEQRVSREIVNTRGQTSVFDLDELMKGSTTERFSSYALGIQWGWMTRNEARAKEDMEPIKDVGELEGLDKPIFPLNMTTGDDDGNPLPPGAAGMPGAAAPGGKQAGKNSAGAATPAGSAANHNITDAKL